MAKRVGLQCDSSMLTVKAYDENCNPCFRDSSLVTFRLEGPGEIVAVDNGNLMSNESYDEVFTHMYHGCASVVIRLNGEPGRVNVWVDSEGMFSGNVVITITENI